MQNGLSRSALKEGGLSFGLEGKVCIVTGASRGLGEAIAKKFAQCGAHVVLVGRTEKDLLQVQKEIHSENGEALVATCDVTVENQINKTVETALKKFGKVDILVNNAGISVRTPILESTVDEWKRILDVNLIGAFLFAKAVGRDMIDNGYGKVINIASEIGIVGSPAGHTAYSSSKGGLIQFTRTLAIEWARFNINVNAIAPGFIRTPLSEHLFRNEEIRSEALSRIPLGRFASPEDVGNAGCFLGSRLSDSITGQVLVVDGGMTVR